MNTRFLKLILILFISVISSSRLSAQESGTYFPYPQVPEDIVTLSGRCNYLVDHFWERCNIKQSFSSLEKLDKAFGDWVSFMPYATTDTLFVSIDRYLNDVAKTGPENLLSVAKMAEKYTYSDSADIYSEELYLPFCKAVVANKKVNKQLKEKYETQARIIESSGLGQRVPNFEFYNADGTKGNLGDVIASRVVLLFVDLDCFDCTMAKARLSADYHLKNLLEMGLVKVVAIYAGDNKAAWMEEAKSYPENWLAVYSPDANKYFELDLYPSIYYLDAKHKVLGKNIELANLLLGIEQINRQMQPSSNP